MRRVISLWLPFFPTDRLRRAVERAPTLDVPLVTIQRDGRGRLVAAADQQARSLGVRSGMPLAAAEILAPNLAAAAADLGADEKTLHQLATWCLRYAPLTAIDPPDGLWIESAGSEHLFGGEAAMLSDMLARFSRAHFSVRAAIADTPGAAHALAHYGGKEKIIVSPGCGEAALTPLSPAALRLPGETVALLARLGIRNIEALARMPRGPLARRVGGVVLTRLDQALGRISEPISPLPPPDAPVARLAFVEPLITAEALTAAIEKLVEALCRKLERRSMGARKLILRFERIDEEAKEVSVATAKPRRDPAHLVRLLAERLPEIDPGFGIGAMQLEARLIEPLGPAQTRAPFAGESERFDLSGLIDRLANRLGPERLYRTSPVESDVPERSFGRVPPLAPYSGKSWPATLPRPARLLSPPEPVRAIALLPDHPPVQFVWRGRCYPLVAGDGPERVFGEWWRNAAETFAVRDYFRVEDRDGCRYWLFRHGDGVDPETGDGCWFLHGFF